MNLVRMMLQWILPGMMLFCYKNLDYTIVKYSILYNKANQFIVYLSFMKREFEKSQTSKPKKRKETGDSEEEMTDDEGTLGMC